MSEPARLMTTEVLALQSGAGTIVSAANEPLTWRPARRARRAIASLASGVHERILPLYAFALLATLWELAPRLQWVEAQFFPPLSRVLAAGWSLAVTGDLFRHLAVSLGRTLAGLGAAFAVGVPLGFLLAGRLPRLTRFFRPLFTLLGQVNAFTLFPVFVLFFGIGELTKFTIIFWACLWPLLLGTLRGVGGVDPLLVKTARSMGCSRNLLVRRVVLPAALPVIIGGARVGALLAFLMLVGAEMIGASAGLGWLVHNSAMNYVIDRLFLAGLLIAVLGAALQRGLVALERRVVFWREDGALVP